MVSQQRLYSSRTSGDNLDPNIPNEDMDDNEAELVDGAESSSTPFDDDYFAADTMPEGEHEAILGLSEFEEALNFFNEKKYDQSEVLLKEALKILKNAQ